MSGNSNKRKDLLLGQPHGTAQGKLRKALLFHYVQLAGDAVCFRCGQKIRAVQDLSIEHKEAWLSSPDPIAAFFEIGNIAFSHLDCNVVARDRQNGNSVKAACVHGHPFDTSNTKLVHGGRQCKACHKQFMQARRQENPTYGR